MLTRPVTRRKQPDRSGHCAFITVAPVILEIWSRLIESTLSDFSLPAFTILISAKVGPPGRP